MIENATSKCTAGIVTNYTFDEVGDLIRVTSANGVSTIYAYDNLGHLLGTNFPDGTFEAYTYDYNGNLVKSVDRNNNSTTYSYDSLNRVSSIKYAGTRTTNATYTYDNNTNLKTMSSQNATITYTYDSRNRVTCETYAVNGATQIGGPCGNGGGGGGSVAAGTLITLADKSRVPVQNLQPGMRLLSYNVTTSEFAVSTITRIATVNTHDMLMIDTAQGRTLRTDNATVQKLWVKRGNGNIGWMSVTQLRVGDSLFVPESNSWTQVTSIKDTPGSYVMYDIYDTSPGDYIANGYLDPVKIPTQGPSVPGGIYPSGYSFQYYYLGENMIQLTYNDYMTAQYTYDGLGRVTSVQFSNANPTKFTYYANNQLKGVQYSNGLIGNYTYNSLELPLRVSLNNTSTNPPTRLLRLDYQYNKTGTVASVTGNSTSTTGRLFSIKELYRYDALQRLVNSYVKSNNTITTISYTYDSVGNRLTQTVNGLRTSYSYNSNNNELTKSNTTTTTTNYGYNNNGQLLAKNVTSTHWTYSWNIQGTLLKATNDSGTQGYYAYDGLGRRVESKETSTLFYGYLGTETLADIGPEGEENNYVYAAGLRIARVYGSSGSNPTIVEYHEDALGSTRLVTSATKSVLFYDNYQPYGQDNSSSGSETYRFTGRPVSQTTGLYYDYQRWYDPTTGRFISTDPGRDDLTQPQSMNKYAYVLDNPSSYVDPDGASPVSIVVKALIGLSFFASITSRFFGGDFGGWWSLNGEFRINPPDFKGQYHVGWEGVRYTEDNGRIVGTLVSKFDRPSEAQPFYHIVAGIRGRSYHIELPEQTGGFSTGMLDALFDHPAAIGGILTGIGLVASAYDVWTAYQQGPTQGEIAVTRELFSWGGAIVGAEAGAAIGTAFFPGVGTVIGGFVGGVVGGLIGEQWGN
ncbi:hypothetical protein J2P12_05755, partial [Candidatus Bathyarchaeota archaeon]|nr:hypothetical protein [Candidatus Bathyarchaeota archaeon]